MSNKTISFLTLPVELVYHILDNLDGEAIFLSFRNVCTRFNTIIDIYHRHQVNFSFISKVSFSSSSKHHSFQQKNHIFRSPPLFNLVFDGIRKSSSILFDHIYE